MVTAKGDLFSDCEVVLLPMILINHIERLCNLASLSLHRYAVAHEAINGLVVAVERAVVVIRLGTKLVETTADLRLGMVVPVQIGGEQPFLDVAIAIAVGPVAEITVFQLVAE